LVPSVLLIWGIVFYKVFSGNSDESDYYPESTVFVPKAGDSVAADSFTIVARYRDPFLGSLWKAPVVQKKVIPKKKVEPPVPIVVHRWPQMSFLGVVQGKSGQLGLLNISGKQNIVKAGAVVEGYTISTFTEDSITVHYENEKKVLYK